MNKRQFIKYLGVTTAIKFLNPLEALKMVPHFLNEFNTNIRYVHYTLSLLNNLKINDMKTFSLIIVFLFSSLFCFSHERKIDTVDIINASKIIPSTKKYIQYIQDLDGSINFNSILTREIQETQY